MRDRQAPEGRQYTGAVDERAPGVRSVTTAELLGEARELLIRHEGREYRLRVTRNGKLILTA